jgi:hypothetical protein
MLPSMGKPGGGGGIGSGGFGAAKVKLQHNNPANKVIILLGTFFIGRKSKKKISLSKFFILII